MKKSCSKIKNLHDEKRKEMKRRNGRVKRERRKH